MLLAVDIGNTNIKFGIYDGENLVHKFSLPTALDISAASLDTSKFPVTNAIVCSVVPEINSSVSDQISTEFGVTASFVTNDLDFGLDIKYEPLSAAGTDRLVNVFSAVEKYVGPCVVCSFGTALTIDAVDENRLLKGGLIAPGMATMARALNLYTSKLPEVVIEKPSSVIQNTTIGSIQSGVVYGYFGLASSLIEQVKAESSNNAKVIATGGFARMIAENTDQIDIVDENLLLDGLMLLHKRLTLRR
ncbi:MAG TPA: type III pantothenate kinase [Pyrinomonadaceae bacterium]|nr:type III pantothenate kinase [Acidobacteriota bacterium]HQZ98094.1 type III pantothenate kinase [Pyrinomonadaceae bacterium]